MLHDARMSAIVREPKTFNNRSGSEWSSWQRKSRRDGFVPKTSDIGEKLHRPDVVFGLGEASQPAVMAVKDSVFGRCSLAEY